MTSPHPSTIHAAFGGHASGTAACADSAEGVRLSSYSRHSFDRGRSFTVVALWRVLGRFLPILPFGYARKTLLRVFGARIESGVIVQPGVKVRYPWRLTIGQDSWVGESCWIDNWASVMVGSNACLSQSAYLCTGNHDWTDPEFRIIPKPILIGDSAWVGARAIIGPGVEIGTGAIVALGSVVTSAIPSWEIHGGNPSQFLKHRRLNPEPT